LRGAPGLSPGLAATGGPAIKLKLLAQDGCVALSQPNQADH